MSDLIRFGVSISSDLLKKFDRLIQEHGYQNRSEAIRDLIRDRLVKEEWQTDKETVGVLAILYDHHVRELAEELTEIQHEFGSMVISSVHVHLDHVNCLEAIVVRGKASQIRSFTDRVIGIHGVKHGQLCMTSTGQSLPT